jgi:hypothetical protein
MLTVPLQELGATEAIEKGYLQQLSSFSFLAYAQPCRLLTAPSFFLLFSALLSLFLCPVFAIYLDPDEPSNVVECYSFTFTYETDVHGNKVRFLSFSFHIARSSRFFPAAPRTPRPEPAQRYGHLFFFILHSSGRPPQRGRGEEASSADDQEVRPTPLPCLFSRHELTFL